jgi:hypothetical protein
MNQSIKNVTIFLFLIVILLVSGCVSSEVNASAQETGTQQLSTTPTIHYFANQSPFIHIDPIQDFHSVSPFNITGPTNFTISGITNFPVGSLFWVDIIEEERNRSLFNNIVIPAELGKDGMNTLSYNANIQGNPPAYYRVEIRKANQNVSGTTHFNVTSQEPWLWTTIDPIGQTREGENLKISGITNLPEGSEIKVSSGLRPHSCPTQIVPGPTNTGGRRSQCFGNCSYAFVENNVRIIPGAEGKNTWNSTLNTTDWCTYEFYWIRAGIINGKYVSEGYTDFLRFGGEPHLVR